MQAIYIQQFRSWPLQPSRETWAGAKPPRPTVPPMPSSACSMPSRLVQAWPRSLRWGGKLRQGKKEREQGCKEEKNSFGRKHSHMQPTEHCDLDYFWNLMFLMFKGRK